MAHTVGQWPETVYPGEVHDECPEALAVIAALIVRMKCDGPTIMIRDEDYNVERKV